MHIARHYRIINYKTGLLIIELRKCVFMYKRVVLPVTPHNYSYHFNEQCFDVLQW